eukprot:CAMPEP_0167773088 /NCGR_PEP_ID=MMETSP0111_2-20121227/1221_1 /TAXON_ID=91324 /ORGANISM="Lotharella globosa, Strain CCCM811" /LENGTH=81 /DNA_ID=CAMNT_0007662677 /DNA_START=207 /DNA_END=452 /DNA_ORIENTATION=+
MKGVPHADTLEGLRDEAPGAYKNLDLVMNNQKELVEVVHRLKPIINVKGIEKRPRQLVAAERQKKSGYWTGGGSNRKQSKG